VVHPVTPLTDWCARESGPGEIWDAAGIEVHNILSTIHPRNSAFVRAQTLLTPNVLATAVTASS
jgi:hypothetical protein